MKTLIIVDPQNDFIEGTLPVDNAKPAMEALAEKLPEIDVDHIVVTMDCHPIKHMSFAPQGGPWPAHCMKYSWGAAIFEPLFQAIYGLRDKREIHFLEKGRDEDKEEYSAFEEGYPEILDESDEVLVCGLAGNVCVHTSINDLIKHGLREKLTVITDASPSLDDGSHLQELIQKEGLEAVTLKTLTEK
ncbi:MAG: isochorismatase family protein [Porphyromonas sp.]|nr:isochorismatase family protein [Porphyromonas sp.]